MKSLMTSRRTLIKATAFSGLAAAIDKTIPIGLIEDAKAASRFHAALAGLVEGSCTAGMPSLLS